MDLAHTRTREEVLQHFDVKEGIGLSPHVVTQRIAKYGYNGRSTVMHACAAMQLQSVASCVIIKLHGHVPVYARYYGWSMRCLIFYLV